MRKYRQNIREQYKNKIKNYIQCKKCLQTFSTHTQMPSRKDDSHNMKSVQVNDKIYFQLPASEIDNIYILGENVGEIINWKILCRKCQNCLGVLDNNRILFEERSIKVTTIKYQACNNISKQVQKTSKKPLYPTSKNLEQGNNIQKKLKKYISLQISRFQQRIQSIDTKKLQTSQKQLRSFLKFFQKWTRHNQNRFSTHSSCQMIRNSSTSQLI